MAAVVEAAPGCSGAFCGEKNTTGTAHRFRGFVVSLREMEDIERMVTRRGFVEVLLERDRAAAASGTRKSRRAIFDDMEEEFEAYFKQPLYWSYDAFKKYKSRHGRGG